jgi:hypothetical protein
MYKPEYDYQVKETNHSKMCINRKLKQMTKQTCIGQQRNDFMLLPVLWGYDIKHTSCKTQIKKTRLCL